MDSSVVDSLTSAHSFRRRILLSPSSLAISRECPQGGTERLLASIRGNGNGRKSDRADKADKAVCSTALSALSVLSALSLFSPFSCQASLGDGGFSIHEAILVDR